MYSLSLEGKVALITGGNGGLGKAIAQGLQQAGARVAVTGRDVAKNESAALDLGPDAMILEMDVRFEDDVIAGVKRVAGEFGSIDILVNCAGSFHGGALTELSLDGWNSVIASHLTGSFLMARETARVMIEPGRRKNHQCGFHVFSLRGARLRGLRCSQDRCHWPHPIDGC